MAQHPRKLFRGHEIHDPGRDRHSGMVRIPPRGKGVGRRVVDDIKPGNGDPPAASQGGKHLPNFANPGIADLLAHLPGSIHRQNDLVGVPPGKKVDSQGKEKGDHHPCVSAEMLSDQKEKARQKPQKNNGLERVDHGSKAPCQCRKRDSSSGRNLSGLPWETGFRKYPLGTKSQERISPG